MNLRQKLGLGISVVIGGVILYGVSNAITWVDAGEIVVIQSPLNGALKCATEPGPTWQGWGSMTHYQRRQQVVFERPKFKGEIDTSIQVRYNDGGHAWVSGVISWEMPLGCEAIQKLHKEFHSVSAIDQQLVQPAITKALYLTSPLMSSTESYAARRTEFLQTVEDQLKNGIYKTTSIQVSEPDPITGQNKLVTKVQLVMDDKGNPVRSEQSSFAIYSLTSLPLTITAIDYDPEIEAQIKGQRDAALSVQGSMANAKKAEQDAITAQQQGLAKAASARAEQEAVKATEVTQAEKERDVAILAAQRDRDVAKLHQEEAEFEKQKNILEGQGESEKKRLILNADGALSQKLDAYIQVNQAYALAIQNHAGNWVPNVVMGGSQNVANGSGAQQLMEMFAVKAAKDLALDLSLPGQGKRQ